MVSKANKKSSPILAIILPAYNEKDVLPYSIPVFVKELQRLIKNNSINSQSFLCIVNDGSTDNTPQVIKNLAAHFNPYIKYIDLQKNQGQNRALIEGLKCAYDKAEIFITLDADGQDTPELVSQMVSLYQKGYDLVFGSRIYDKNTIPLSKIFRSNSFYLLCKLLKIPIIPGHAEARLISKRALSMFLSQKNYKNILLRIYFPSLNLNKKVIKYIKKDREKGKSKYNFGKLVKLGWKIIYNHRKDSFQPK